jgi:hypothetical protein
MTTLQSLLEKGYFPRELPPPFSTTGFASYSAVFGSSWPKGKWTRCCGHNLARPGGLRRPLEIPNPISYLALAEILASNWTQLRQHAWKVRLSASRPHVMKKSTRAVVPRYRYAELPRLRALRRRGNRYLLHTDISQFYPTLYTHTVPWALHTKAICKAALATAHKGKHLLGNQIDGALQAMNEGQTHGIPIGPDTSLIVAEVLLTAVDETILLRHPTLIHGFRYIDDYELSFAKLSDAEQVLTELQGILAQYELTLNPRKTKVDELPKGIIDSWAVELGRFPVRGPGNPVGQRNDLLALFSRAFEVASGRVEEPVLRYAIARVRSINVSPNGWRAFQNCILSAAGAEPSAMAAALGTLHEVAALGGHSVSKSPLAEIFENVIARHAPRGQGSEVAWVLWGALAWSIPLSPAAAQAVGAMDDDIVALLALDADARGLFPPGALGKQSWVTMLNQAGALHREHWLLAYEANRQNWLACPAIASDPVFSAMNGAAISFYDPSQNVPQFPLGARGLPGGTLPDHYA